MKASSIALAAAMSTVLTMGVIDTADAASKKKEKCYGVSAAGQNDCANLAGTHSCAGQSTVDNDIGEWRLVAGGLCEELGGFDRKTAKKMYEEQKAEKNS